MDSNHNQIAVLAPGVVLKTLYLEPLGMSAGALAQHLKVPRTRIERVINGQTALSPDTALRLARFFKTSPQLWLNMQASWDLQQHASALEAELTEIVPLDASAA